MKVENAGWAFSGALLCAVLAFQDPVLAATGKGNPDTDAATEVLFEVVLPEQVRAIEAASGETGRKPVILGSEELKGLRQEALYFSDAAVKFYTAVGTLEFLECVISNDPTSCIAFRRHLLEPGTYLGFAAFVFAARGTSSFVLWSSGGKVNLPYLGLAAGLIASDLFSAAKLALGESLRSLHEPDPVKADALRAKALDEAWSKALANPKWWLDKVPEYGSLVLASLASTATVAAVDRSLELASGLQKMKRVASAAATAREGMQALRAYELASRGIRVVWNGSRITRFNPVAYAAGAVAETMIFLVWNDRVRPWLTHLWSEETALSELDFALAHLEGTLSLERDEAGEKIARREPLTISEKEFENAHLLVSLRGVRRCARTGLVERCDLDCGRTDVIEREFLRLLGALSAGGEDISAEVLAKFRKEIYKQIPFEQKRFFPALSAQADAQTLGSGLLRPYCEDARRRRQEWIRWPINAGDVKRIADFATAKELAQAGPMSVDALKWPDDLRHVQGLLKNVAVEPAVLGRFARFLRAHPGWGGDLGLRDAAMAILKEDFRFRQVLETDEAIRAVHSAWGRFRIAQTRSSRELQLQYAEEMNRFDAQIIRQMSWYRWLSGGASFKAEDWERNILGWHQADWMEQMEGGHARKDSPLGMAIRAQLSAFFCGAEPELAVRRGYHYRYMPYLDVEPEVIPFRVVHDPSACWNATDLGRAMEYQAVSQNAWSALGTMETLERESTKFRWEVIEEVNFSRELRVALSRIQRAATPIREEINDRYLRRMQDSLQEALVGAELEFNSDGQVSAASPWAKAVKNGRAFERGVIRSYWQEREYWGWMAAKFPWRRTALLEAAAGADAQMVMVRQLQTYLSRKRTGAVSSVLVCLFGCDAGSQDETAKEWQSYILR
jgi:hypothetical protein